VLWGAGVLLAVVVAVIGLARFVLRRPSRSPARVLWRIHLATTASLAIAAALVASVYQRGLIELGRFGPATGGSYVMLWLSAMLAVVGAVIALRSAPLGAHDRRWAPSTWAARAVVALDLVSAAYLLFWGPIGWRTWA
jgi:hypothetical protein